MCQRVILFLFDRLIKNLDASKMFLVATLPLWQQERHSKQIRQHTYRKRLESNQI